MAPSALLTLHRMQSEHPHSSKPLLALINASVHELHTIALKISLKHYPQLKTKTKTRPTSEVTLVVLRKLLILYTHTQLCKHTTQTSCLVPFPVIVRTYPEESNLKEKV